MDGVVSPVLHNKPPIEPDAVKVDLSQLSTTETTGASGIVFGVASPLPELLVHPLSVCVTV